jgi:hypothetical protein
MISAISSCLNQRVLRNFSDIQLFSVNQKSSAHNCTLIPQVLEIKIGDKFSLRILMLLHIQIRDQT